MEGAGDDLASEFGFSQTEAESGEVIINHSTYNTNCTLWVAYFDRRI